MTAGAAIQVEARTHALADTLGFLEVLQAGLEERMLVVGEIRKRQAGARRAAAHAGIHLRICRARQCGCGQASPHDFCRWLMSVHDAYPFRVSSMLMCR